MTDQKDEPSARKKANRIAGLLCYAGAVVAAGITVFTVIEQFSVKQHDFTPTIIFGAFTLILLGIGYSTGQRK